MVNSLDFPMESDPFSQRATLVCAHFTPQHLQHACTVRPVRVVQGGGALICISVPPSADGYARRQDPELWEQAPVGQVEDARTWTRRGLVRAHIVSAAPTSYPLLLRAGGAFFVGWPSSHSHYSSSSASSPSDATNTPWPAPQPA